MKLYYANHNIYIENNIFVYRVIFIEFLNKNTRFNCEMLITCTAFIMRKDHELTKCIEEQIIETFFYKELLNDEGKALTNCV
jgi:hypothetical protein